jgi:enoyl-CoA hydratase
MSAGGGVSCRACGAGWRNFWRHRAPLDGAECVALGLASHYIESDTLDAVKEQLYAHPETVESILAGATSPVPEARIVAHPEAIDLLFASDVYEEILAALRADGSESLEQLDVHASKSPTACKVSLRMLVESPRHLLSSTR